MRAVRSTNREAIRLSPSVKLPYVINYVRKNETSAGSASIAEILFNWLFYINFGMFVMRIAEGHHLDTLLMWLGWEGIFQDCEMSPTLIPNTGEQPRVSSAMLLE